MDAPTMERVTVAAKIENAGDLEMVARGAMKASDVRFVEIPDALVDTGATMVSAPLSIIEKLGLRRVRERRARTAGGRVTVHEYSSVRLTIQGRDCITEVSELPDDCPVLIGQIPLEFLDWVVDLKNQRLIGNPEHGGEWMHDRL